MNGNIKKNLHGQSHNTLCGVISHMIACLLQRKMWIHISIGVVVGGRQHTSGTSWITRSWQ